MGNARKIELARQKTDMLYDALAELRSLVAEAVMNATSDKEINDLMAIGLNVNAVVEIIKDNTFFDKE